ncbi:MAG TPA: DUF1028 domain-containing protein [Mycobacterium sp.]|nr:DUF1028 domain-containing protein [Mycobacterium sp.]
MTFSLLAREPSTGQLGVASQSHYFGVGSAVIWAEAGVGVVATQAFVDRSYGPRGLALMRAGRPAGDALSLLLGEDPDRELRQVAYLDSSGGLGIHSGRGCVAAAGVAVGEQVVALGNTLASEQVLGAMLLGYQQADGDLAHRLTAGLGSAERAGGDIRGSQSAALRVVDGEQTDAPWNGVGCDLRVDDHADPVGELAHLVDLNRAFEMISRVVFDTRGPLLGAPNSASDAKFLAAAAALADAGGVLNDNPEATFWSAVLHGRWGRMGDAQRLFAEAARLNPRLPLLLQRLSDTGVLTSDQVTALLENHCAPPG